MAKWRTRKEAPATNGSIPPHRSPTALKWPSTLRYIMRRILSGGRSLTVAVYPDFSFRDEWSGVYHLDEKVLDYIAVKTEWGWAAPENAIPEKTTVARNVVSFHHKINGHEVTVELSVKTTRSRGAELEQLVVRVNGSQENVLEMGVCGRHAYEQNCGKTDVRGAAITAGKTALTIFPDDQQQPVIQDLGMRTHVQGDKHYDIRVVRAPFKENVLLDIRHHPPRFVKAVQTKNASFNTDSAAWNELYKRAKDTINVLTKRRGWYAGLPWFVQYWGRDTFLSVPALIREGYAPLVKETLCDFTSKIVDGEIPRLIKENGAPEFGSIDTNPLLLNAVADYVTITGDHQLLAEASTAIQEAFTWILEGADGYLPRSNGKDTWMDTLEIRKCPVEVAAYTVDAIRKLARLGQLPGVMYGEAKEQWDRDKKKYLLERSANILLAAVYGLIPAGEALQRAKEWQLITEQGVRSWSPLEPEYDPKGYHTGAIWGLTTAAGLYVALDAGDWDTALALRDSLLARAQWTRYLDEVWDANTGEPIGADAQLWSAAMIIRAIDEVIVNKRRLPPDVKRLKRVRWEKGGLRKIWIDRNHQGKTTLRSSEYISGG